MVTEAISDLPLLSRLLSPLLDALRESHGLFEKNGRVAIFGEGLDLGASGRRRVVKVGSSRGLLLLLFGHEAVAVQGELVPPPAYAAGFDVGVRERGPGFRISVGYYE